MELDSLKFLYGSLLVTPLSCFDDSIPLYRNVTNEAFIISPRKRTELAL